MSAKTSKIFFLTSLDSKLFIKTKVSHGFLVVVVVVADVVVIVVVEVDVPIRMRKKNFGQ
jgi:hypothetical protein